jgi:hypothetical protein
MKNSKKIESLASVAATSKPSKEATVNPSASSLGAPVLNTRSWADVVKNAFQVR